MPKKLEIDFQSRNADLSKFDKLMKPVFQVFLFLYQLYEKDRALVLKSRYTKLTLNFAH